jgi:hypothetical protein
MMRLGNAKGDLEAVQGEKLWQGVGRKERRTPEKKYPRGQMPRSDEAHRGRREKKFVVHGWENFGVRCTRKHYTVRVVVKVG